MKKKLISSLSVIVMMALVVLAVLFVKNEGTETYADHTHCICGTNEAVGDHTSCTDVTWTAWTSKTALPTVSSIPEGATAGYFYLTEDVTFSASWNPGSARADCGGKTVAICLNGHTITKTGASRGTTYLSSYVDSKSVQCGNLNVILTDCAETPGTFTRSANCTDHSGALIWMGGNSSKNAMNNTLSIFNIEMTHEAGVSSAKDGAAVLIDANESTANFYNVHIHDIETTDTKNGGIVVIANSSTGNFYGTTIEDCTCAAGGAVKGSSSGTVNLLEGTVVKNNVSPSGGNAILFSNSNLNIRNASLIGGKAATGAGGNLEIRTSGTINLYDGAVIDGGCTVASGKNGGNISTNDSAAANCTINIYDGAQIINGKSVNIAGNIQHCYGTINMYGGVIKDGLCSSTNPNANTANVHVYGNSASFNMTGGTIEGHINVKSGYARFSGTAVIKDPDNTSTGGLSLTNTYYGSATSYAKTDDYTFGPFEEGAEIYFTEISLGGNKTTVTEAIAGATEYTDNWNNTLKTDADYSYKNFVTADPTKYVIVVVDNDGNGIAETLKWYSATGSSAHCHCICGGTLEDGKTYGVGDYAVTHHCADVIFTQATISGGAFTRPSASGHYYLTQDCTSIAGGAAQYGKNIDICFNGYTLNQNASRLYQTNSVPSGSTAAAAASHIRLTDCVGDGGISCSYAATTNQGGLIWTGADIPTTTEIYAGIYDYSGRTQTSGEGGIINISNNASFSMFGGKLIGIGENTTLNYAGNLILRGSAVANIYGGIITGGHAVSSETLDEKYRNQMGGNVYMSGDDSMLNIFGGEISDGSAIFAEGTLISRGGNIQSLGANAQINIYGGKISGGEAGYGGNIYVGGGALTLNDGLITGGKSVRPANKADADVYGGNVAVTSGKLFTMNGGTISDGSSVKNGGNVRVNGKFILNDGIISGGSAPTGGNVFVNISNDAGTYGIFEMNGGTIKNGIADNGGNLAVNGTGTYVNAKATINGGIIENGSVNNMNSGKGGNVFNGGDLIINDAIIRGGKAFSGGNIYCDGNSTRTNPVTLLIKDGEFYNGEGNGGNIYIHTRAEVVINGGEFYNAKQLTGDKSVANIGNNAGKLTINGGIFTKDYTITDTTHSVWYGPSAMESSINGGYLNGIWSNSSNGLKNFITGGYFVTKPNANYIATDKAAVRYAPQETKTIGGKTITYVYKIGTGIAVTLTSETTEGGASVATLTGGDNYEAGTAYTIKAPLESKGYTFVGWYEGSASGTKVSDDAEYTVSAGSTTDKTYVAVYRFGSSTIELVVNGLGYDLTVGTEKEALTGTTTKNPTIGTKVTVAYTGSDDFFAWKNENNKVVSYEESYTFDIYTNTQLIAELAVAAGNTRVVFVNDGNQVVKVIDMTAAITEADIPETPIRMYREGGHWDKTLDEINAAIADATVDTITVKAIGYVKTEDFITLIEDATVPEIEFQDKTNVVTKQQLQKDGKDVYTISIGATRSVPAGFVLQEQGILYTTSKTVVSVDEAKAALYFGSATAFKYRSPNTKTDDLTTLNIKNVPEGYTIYAKGYLVYTEEGSDVPQVIYTDLDVATTAGITIEK